jgi:hypothetical protein
MTPTDAIQQIIRRNGASVGAVDADEWRQPALRDPLHTYATALRTAARALDNGDGAALSADPVDASAPPVVRLRELGRLSVHVSALLPAADTAATSQIVVGPTPAAQEPVAEVDLATLHAAGEALAQAVADSRRVDRPVVHDTAPQPTADRRVHDRPVVRDAAPRPIAVRRAQSPGALTRVLERCAAWSPAGH